MRAYKAARIALRRMWRYHSGNKKSAFNVSGGLAAGGYMNLSITDPAVLVALGTCVATILWAVRRTRPPRGKKDSADTRASEPAPPAALKE